MRLRKLKRTAFLLTALMAFMGAFYIQAYACATDAGDDVTDTLAVSTTWLDAEMLRIDILNEGTGAQTSLAIRAADYLVEGENSPLINIQAVDVDGNSSGVIQIQNPFYIPDTVSEEVILCNGEIESVVEVVTEAGVAEDDPDAQQPSPHQPLTPDGTGTVVDNVLDTNGIEFFTIFTEDGNEFFLIVDRQRTEDNVYLLNTVTEEDLISLAHAGGREVAPVGSGLEAGVPVPVHPTAPEDNAGEVGDEEAREEQPPATATGNNNLIIIVIIALAVGGAGYYFKIHKKKNAPAVDSYDEDEDDSFDDDWDEGAETGGADDEE